MQDKIIIKHAAEHNLKVDYLEIPKNQLVVFTGVSGSGKSSLAFDTLYAEGQRRYVESLSAYARQFLGQLDKPKYEKLSGLSPTIAIEQKSASNNPRSTVGTITEIYDYMRVLWARAGTQHCHLCGRPVEALSSQQLVDEISQLPAGAKVELRAPLVANRKGEHRDVLVRAKERGFVRMWVDGTQVRLDEELPHLQKSYKHTLELVIDRVVAGKVDSARLADSIETALKEADGEIVVAVDGEEPRRHSTKRSCPTDQIGFEELSPQCFSFNTPLGACPACHGLGTRLEADVDLLVPNPKLSIRGGAVKPLASVLANTGSWSASIFDALENQLGVDLDRPWEKLPWEQRRLVLHGTGGERVRVDYRKGTSSRSVAMEFEGVATTILRRLHQTSSDEMREYYQSFLSQVPCTDCGGSRLRPQSRAVLIAGQSIDAIVALSVAEARAWFLALNLEGGKRVVAEELCKEITARLTFLHNVGLSYLTLNRLGPSLSGGEAQRIRLASQLGAELSGVLYVLDEPSIGLHPRDGERLLQALEGLRDLGNTVIVVEHDRETIERADHVVDFGPGAGAAGGRVVAEGSPAKVAAAPLSITGAYLSGRMAIPKPAVRRNAQGAIRLEGATQNNLKDVDLELPLGVFTVFTGVSGAGKSSLLSQTLLPALERDVNGALVHPGPYRKLEGLTLIDKVVHIDQKPIGRTPRSNPATYTKAFDEIREVMALLPESRAFGFEPGRFSFNVRGGRCDACHGAGVTRVEMHFLADVYVTCEVCRGQRYNEATLRVHFKGRNIRELLDTTVDEALVLFADHPRLRRILQTLQDVGMGYVKLGQPATTLSGGEAQRIKLSRELARRDTGRTLYVLDEPTTGLHFDDVRKLLVVLQRLVDHGNTVAVIEHNMDVIKCADWVIDLGPEGGEGGGNILATGTPEQVAKQKSSYTGTFLAKALR